MPHSAVDASPPKRPGRKTRISYPSRPADTSGHDTPPRLPAPTYSRAPVRATSTNEEVLRYGMGPINLVQPGTRDKITDPHYHAPAVPPPRLPQQTDTYLPPPNAPPHLPTPAELARIAVDPVAQVIRSQRGELRNPPVGGELTVGTDRQYLNPLNYRGPSGPAAFAPIAGPRNAWVHARSAVIDALSYQTPDASAETPTPEAAAWDAGLQRRLQFDESVVQHQHAQQLADPKRRGLPLEPGHFAPSEQAFIDRLALGPKVTQQAKPPVAGSPRTGYGPRGPKKGAPPLAAIDPENALMGAEYLGAKGLLNLISPSASRALSGVVFHYVWNDPEKLRNVLPGFDQVNVMPPEMKAWFYVLARHYHVPIAPNENEVQIALDVTQAMKGHPNYVEALAHSLPGSLAKLAIGTPAFYASLGAASVDLATGDPSSSIRLAKSLGEYYAKIFTGPGYNIPGVSRIPFAGPVAGSVARSFRDDPAGTVAAVLPLLKGAGLGAGRVAGLRAGPEIIEGPRAADVTQDPITDVAPQVPGFNYRQPVVRDASANLFWRPVQVAVDYLSRGPRRTPEGALAARNAVTRLPETIRRQFFGRKGESQGISTLWNVRLRLPAQKDAAALAAKYEHILHQVFNEGLLKTEPANAGTIARTAYLDATYALDPAAVLKFMKQRRADIAEEVRIRQVGQPGQNLQNARGTRDVELENFDNLIPIYEQFARNVEKVKGDPKLYAEQRAYLHELEKQALASEILVMKHLGMTQYDALLRRYAPHITVSNYNLASDLEAGMPPAKMGGSRPGETPPDYQPPGYTGGPPSARPEGKPPSQKTRDRAYGRRRAGGEPEPGPVPSGSREPSPPAPAGPEAPLTPHEQQAAQEEAQQQAEIAANRPPEAAAPPKPKRARRPRAARPARPATAETPAAPAATETPVEPAPAAPAVSAAETHIRSQLDKAREITAEHPPAVLKKWADTMNKLMGRKDLPRALGPELLAEHDRLMLAHGKRVAAEEATASPEPPATHERQAPPRETPVGKPAEAAKPAPKAAPKGEPTHADLVAQHTETYRPQREKLQAYLADPAAQRRAAEYLHAEQQRKGGMHASPHHRENVHKVLADLTGIDKGGFYDVTKRGQRHISIDQWQERLNRLAKFRDTQLGALPKTHADEAIRVRNLQAEQASARVEGERAAEQAGGSQADLVDRYVAARDAVESGKGIAFGYDAAGKAARAAHDRHVREAEATMRAVQQKLGVSPAEIERMAAARGAETVPLPHGEAKLYETQKADVQKQQDALRKKLAEQTAKPVTQKIRPERPIKAKEQPLHHAAQAVFNALQEAKQYRLEGKLKAEADVIDTVAELLGETPRAVRDLLGQTERGAHLHPWDVQDIIKGEKTGKTLSEKATRTAHYRATASVEAMKRMLAAGETPTAHDRIGYVQATGRPSPRTLDDMGLLGRDIAGGAPTPEEEAAWNGSFMPGHDPIVPEPGLETLSDELVTAGQPLEDGRPAIQRTSNDDPQYVTHRLKMADEAYRDAVYNHGLDENSTEAITLDNKRQLAFAELRAQVINASGRAKSKKTMREMVGRTHDEKGRLRYKPVPPQHGEPIYTPFIRNRGDGADYIGGTEKFPLSTDPTRLYGSRAKHFKSSRILRGDYEPDPNAVYAAIAQPYRVQQYKSLVELMVVKHTITALPNSEYDGRRYVAVNVGPKADIGISRKSSGRSPQHMREMVKAYKKAADEFESSVVDLEGYQEGDPVVDQKVKIIYNGGYRPAMNGGHYISMPPGQFVLMPRTIYNLLLAEARGGDLPYEWMRKAQKVTAGWRNLALLARPAWLVNNVVGNTALVLLGGAGSEALRAVGRAVANTAFRAVRSERRLEAIPVPVGVDYHGQAAQLLPHVGQEGKVRPGQFGFKHAWKQYATVRSMRDLYDPTRWAPTAWETGKVALRLTADANVAIENAQRRTIARSQIRKMANRRVGRAHQRWLAKLTGDWARVKRDFARHVEDIGTDQRAADQVMASVNDFLGNFQHGVPHPYADLLYPFWRWTAFMGKLMFWTLPAKYPGRTALLAGLSNVGWQASAQEGSVPERFAGGIPIAGPATNRLILKLNSIWPLATIGNFVYAHPGDWPSGAPLLSGVNPVFDTAMQFFIGKTFPEGYDVHTPGGKPAGIQSGSLTEIGRSLANAVERNIPILNTFEGRQLAGTNTIADTLGSAIGIPGFKEQYDPKYYAQVGKQPSYSLAMRLLNYIGFPGERVNLKMYNQKEIEKIISDYQTLLNNRAKRELKITDSPAVKDAWWRKHKPPQSLSATPGPWAYLLDHPKEFARIVTHGTGG